MINKETVNALKRDSLKTLFSFVLLVLAMSRTNLGDLKSPASSGDNPSTLEMIQIEEQLEKLDMWTDIYTFSDNIAAATCLFCAIISGVLIFYKNNDQMNRGAVVLMMVLLSANVITILVSDLSSWQLGQR